MKVIDPGHRYKLAYLDKGFYSQWNRLWLWLRQHISRKGVLQFVKREGPNYPGNIGHYPGTTMQEVLRVLIDRAKYVDNQIPNDDTKFAIYCMREAIYHFEIRAAHRHRRPFTGIITEIENEPTCPLCGHIKCNQSCREKNV